MKLGLSAVLLGALGCFIEARPADEKLELIEDMIVTPEQKEYYNELKNGRVRRAAIKDKWLWPGGVVYYKFNKNLSKKGQSIAKDAMKHWEDKTCLKFRNLAGIKTTRKFYAEFKFDGDCRAAIGYSRQPAQLISIGSEKNPCPLGPTIHEIGHTVGFFHEHSRPDRDKYIEIIEKNMLPDQWVKDQFKKVDPKWIDSRGHKYDYGSIMHYSQWQGAKDEKSPVMKAKKKGVTFGERDGLSEGDIAQIKDMYKCNDKGESDLPMDIPPPTEDEEKDETGGPKPGDVEE